MKKLVLLSSIAVLGLAYQGCGVTKKDALNSLSSSIYVSVNNQFSKDEEVHSGFMNFFSKSVKATSTQSSNVVLKNIKYTQKNNKWCAEVSKDEVLSSAKETLKFLNSFKLDDLPTSFKEKQKTIKDVLPKIAFVKAILNLKQSEISKLNNLEKQLKDLANKGAVVFNINIPYAEIKISGIKKTFNPSQEIMLPAGEYSYKITADGYENEMGKFKVKAGEEITVNESLESKQTLKSIKTKDDYFTKSTELDIDYGYAITTDHHPEWDAQKRIEVRMFKNYGIYKLGFGILGGTNTHWTAKDMDELEFVLAARVQFPELFDTYFHIGSVSVIPYIGAEGGWDVYKFIDKSTHKTEDISNVTRGVLGSTFLIHKQFGFNIQYAHDFMDKKDHIVSAGIVMDF